MNSSNRFWYVQRNICSHCMKHTSTLKVTFNLVLLSPTEISHKIWGAMGLWWYLYSYDCLSIFHRSFSLHGHIIVVFDQKVKLVVWSETKIPTMNVCFRFLFFSQKQKWYGAWRRDTNILSYMYNNLMHYGLLPVMFRCCCCCFCSLSSLLQFWTINVDARSLKYRLRQSKFLLLCSYLPEHGHILTHTHIPIERKPH